MTSYDIEMNFLHKCTEEMCSKTFFLQFPMGMNPDYNVETKRCSRYGQVQGNSVHVKSFNVNDWEKSTYGILGPDEIVIKDSEIGIVFSYPLEKPFEFKFKSEGGFTKKGLFHCITEQYKKIYKEEQESSEIDVEKAQKERTGYMALCMNRPTSNGKYGIWGHSIGDLWIEGIEYNSETKKVHLSIGS